MNESPKAKLKPIVVIEIPGRLPSWNQILAMQHWQRYKFKAALAKSFLLALQQSELASSTSTICAKNTMSIYAATLRSYLTMIQQRRLLRSANKKLAKAKKNSPASKSTRSKKT